ncbi:secreted protein containing DUF302 [Candidatus Thiomargarita nelsonii]|uniref:Secreted protein containing DUF302 n=1 Tax=Candidatus Thiomargarita nelsonii TaxID=1003181 RepID=A0A0A6NZD1_9GAMM|nr:secreted protein containing DUF302 [Candidatus Thiomargarita nelsonii]
MITRLIAMSLLLVTIVSAEEMAFIDQMVIKVPIGDKSLQEAGEYLKNEAKKRGIQQVGYSPLYKEYQALGLSNIRHVEIFQFCDAKVAKALTEYNMSFAVHIPCRVSLIEDEQGKGWFVMMNPMIFKSSMLSPDLQKQAACACGKLMEIIGASATVAQSTNQLAMDIDQTVVKMQISEDISIDEAIDSLTLHANDLNVKRVGHQNLTKEYEKLGLPNIRRTEIFQFCDAIVAQQMLRDDIRYVAYMPCQIAIVEDEHEQGWFVMMNMDMFIALFLNDLIKNSFIYWLTVNEV